MQGGVLNKLTPSEDLKQGNIFSKFYKFFIIEN